MSFVDAGLRAEFEDLTESAMPDTAVFITPGGRTVTDGGGWTDGVATESDPVPCRTKAADKPREIAVADRLQEVGLEVLVVPLGTTATADAGVRVTGTRSGAVTTYTIAGVVPQGSHSADQRFLIRKVA